MLKSKWVSLFVVMSVLLSLFSSMTTVNAADYSVEQWKRVDITLTSSNTYTYPDTDVSITAAFIGPDSTVITLPGFWDGGNTWKVRFAPTKIGLWSYTITCTDTTDTGLHNKTGTIQCNAYTGNVDTYKHGFVKVSDNHRYFVHDDGTPFFWLGDTHWQMPNYERQDVCNYPGCSCGNQFRHVVDDRKSKGFTVYQTYPDSAMNSGGGNADRFDWWTTQYTHLNPQAFKDNLDPMMDYLAEQGFVIALGMGLHNQSDDMGQTAFNHFTKYMVARYASYPVVWITGQEVALGDLTIWKSVAETINQYDGYNHPLSGHLTANGEPTTWGQETWHDWFATQGGHKNIGIRTQAHYQTYWNYSPTKPFLETEAMYEDVNCGGVASTKDMRISAWKALQCGSYGYTYGVAGIWAIKWDYSVPGWDGYNNGIPWFDGIDKLGSTQMTNMKNFYQYAGWSNLVPRFGSSTWGTFSDTEKSVLSSEGSDTYVVYFYNSAIDTGTLKNMDNSKTYRAKWFNPITGMYITISDSISPVNGTYIIPSKPDIEDWVLLVTNKDLGAVPTPPPSPTPTPSNEIVSEWRLDGNANDSAGTNNGTAYGGLTYAAAKKNQGASFDGVNDYIGISDSTSLDGMSQISVSAWVKLDALPAGDCQIVNKEGCYRINLAADGTVHFVIATTNNGWYTSGTRATANTKLTPGNWYHIVGTYDGSYVKIFINGAYEVQGTQNISGNIISNSNPFQFAKGNTSNYLDGIIDEVILYNTALTSTTVQNLYNSYGIISEWGLDGNANDSAGTNNGTAYGGLTYAAAKKNQGASFDGVNDYIGISDSTSLDGMSQISVSTWVKVDALPADNCQIVNKEYSYRINLAADGTVHFAVATTNNGWYTAGTKATANTILTPGNWYHIVGTYDGSHVKIYINGIYEAQGTQAISGNITNNANPLRFAKGSTSAYLDGIIDEVNLYNTALASTAVHSLYYSYLL